MRGLAAFIAALALLAAGPLAAALAAPDGSEANATLPDIEDEVMCTICGTALQLSDSPQAEAQRAFINDLIAQGNDKDQIKTALVDEYGPAVLAVPAAEGFDLAAWIVPIGGVLAALVAIGLAARRWRCTGAEREDDRPAGGDTIDAEDEKRLRDDLARYQV